MITMHTRPRQTDEETRQMHRTLKTGTKKYGKKLKLKNLLQLKLNWKGSVVPIWYLGTPSWKQIPWQW